MKKITIFLAVFSIVFISSVQAGIRLGVKAGVNLANASFSTDAVRTSNFTGFQAGPVLELGIPLIPVKLDVAALYSQQGLKFKLGDNDFEEKESKLDVPVNLKFKFGLAGTGVFLSAGPYVSFDLSKDNFSQTVADTKDKFENKDFGAGINVGGGIELLKHLQVSANYKIGLTDDYKSTVDIADIHDPVSILTKGFKGKTRVWSITATYFF